MTEVPEHLLARSRARRAGASGGGDAAAPATTGESKPAAPTSAAAAAPAAAVEAPKPEKAKPKLPWVEAGESRRKIPVWAVSALVALPIWAVMYATTNDPQSPKVAGPLTTGATVYSQCAACHGATGGGGVGPALSGGAVVTAFPDPAEHIRWVMLGTAGYQAEGTATYGAEGKTVGEAGNMPAQLGLESADLLAVIRHERETLSGETFDAAAWDEAVKTLEADENAEVAGKAKEFRTIVDGWKSLAPGA